MAEICGVTTLDTAPFYGFGLSEELIGEAIKEISADELQLIDRQLDLITA